jgi:enoyl-CoA hydratase/carnithine racemase
LRIDDQIATVTLDRPDIRNSLTEPVATGLIERFKTLRDSNARCVMIRSSGDTFCGGGDVGAMVDGTDRETAPTDRMESVIGPVQDAIKAVHTCRLPVVAKLDGAAFGSGAGLALACDIQLASPDAAMGFGFCRLGLAADAGVSYFLPRIVGPNKAKELLFTGELLDADAARELGLFTRLFEDSSFEEGVENIVTTVADGPTVALEQTKRLIDRGTESTFETALDRETTAHGLAATTADHGEGTEAFLDQREPEFEGR